MLSLVLCFVSQTYQLDRPVSRFSYATLIVSVTDVNNHAPQMAQRELNLTLPENSPIGYQVAQVSAVDRDQVTTS